jgi:hypothetical protein
MTTIYEEALKLIDQKYSNGFLRFTQTGEADKQFLDYLDTSSNAQKAVDMIFQAQARAFEDFARRLRKDSLESKVDK